LSAPVRTVVADQRTKFLVGLNRQADSDLAQCRGAVERIVGRPAATALIVRRALAVYAERLNAVEIVQGSAIEDEVKALKAAV
jgi:hypothetical protein